MLTCESIAHELAFKTNTIAAKLNMELKLENISVRKNDYPILKNINFHDTENRSWVITGNSGSGKSTFLDLIAGNIFPAQGDIYKDNSKKIVLVSRDYSFNQIVGKAYQYYQQRYNAYDSEIGPTVYEVLQNQILPIGTVDTASVELPPLAHSLEKIEEVAQKFSITHLLDRKVTSLSNGETRRSLLAYWFLQNPDVLLLDNPFAGLDAESRSGLRQALEQIKNVQIYLVADFKDIPIHISNVIQLSDGVIVYCGSITHLIQEQPAHPVDWQVQLKKIQHPPSIENDTFEIAFKLVNVCVDYDEKRVLNNINWEVRNGEQWAVLGPNGSGKTTLLSLLTGDHPQAYRNEIYLFDKRRGSGESIWDIKKRIGFVSPELHLYLSKSIAVHEIIGSGFFDTLSLLKALNEQQETIMNNYLHFFDIYALKSRKFGQLSSGQQRTVLLIRALVKNPSVLILDEPCQGLDYSQMIFFRDALNEIVVSQKKTLLYITHYLDEIPQCVHKKLHLNNGNIVKIETE